MNINSILTVNVINTYSIELNKTNNATLYNRYINTHRLHYINNRIIFNETLYIHIYKTQLKNK